MTAPHVTSSKASPDIQEHVASIANRFAVEGAFVIGEEIQSGHINSTYRVTFLATDGTEPRFIIQSINRNVFN